MKQLLSLILMIFLSGEIIAQTQIISAKRVNISEKLHSGQYNLVGVGDSTGQFYYENMQDPINPLSGVNLRTLQRSIDTLTVINEADPIYSVDSSDIKSKLRNLDTIAGDKKVTQGDTLLTLEQYRILANGFSKVDSLNVGLLDGKKASDFQLNSDTLTWDATLSDLQDSASAIRALTNTKAVVSGTTNYIPKITGTNTLGNSSIIDNSGNIGIGTTEPLSKFDVIGDFRFRRSLGMGTSGSIYFGGGYGDYIFGGDQYNVFAFGLNGTEVVRMTTSGLGAGTLTPAARIHSQSTGTQARLGYDATKYTDLSTGSTGDLTITPSGGEVIVAGDIVGDSIRAANFKMSTGAGKNKVMMSDSFGNGYWAEALGVPEVGDYYGGGLVYYVSPSGTYGYCVYPSVIATNTYWSPTNNNAAIATNQAVGAGIANTTAIVAVFGAGNYAAYKVDTLTIGGYSDWALPSAGDADMIHDSLYSTFESSSLIYLANDEGNVGKSYVWNTGTYQNQFMKGTAYSDLGYKVIAVRRFTISTQSFNLAVAESDGSPNYSAINTIQFANSVLSQPANNTVLVTPNSMNGDQIVAALNANDSTTLTKALAAPQLIMTGTSYNYLWSQYYNNAYDYGIYLTQTPKGGYSDLLKFDANNKIFYIPRINLENGGYVNSIGTGAATGSSTTKLATEDLVVKTIAASGGGGMVYPGAGIPVSTGSAWGTSKTAPSGAIVGTTDSQALTNKSVNGVTLSTSAGATNFLSGDGTYRAVSGGVGTSTSGQLLYNNSNSVGGIGLYNSDSLLVDLDYNGLKAERIIASFDNPQYTVKGENITFGDNWESMEGGLSGLQNGEMGSAFMSAHGASIDVNHLWNWFIASNNFTNMLLSGTIQLTSYNITDDTYNFKTYNVVIKRLGTTISYLSKTEISSVGTDTTALSNTISASYSYGHYTTALYIDRNMSKQHNIRMIFTGSIMPLIKI